MAAATALEDCPVQARGVISGLLQEGYAFGYLLCVVFTRAIADTSPFGWRALFWFGSGPPVLIIIFRLCLPETDTYLLSKKNAAEAEGIEKNFWRGIKMTFKTYWLMFAYLVVLMGASTSCLMAHRTCIRPCSRNSLDSAKTDLLLPTVWPTLELLPVALLWVTLLLSLEDDCVS